MSGESWKVLEWNRRRLMVCLPSGKQDRCHEATAAPCCGCWVVMVLPQHSGDLGWRILSAAMGTGRTYAGVGAPFRVGLFSNVPPEVMNDPAAHLCGIAGIWRCNVKPEDSFGAWKGLTQ